MVSDSGPVYRETGAGDLLVEPWNTSSNLVFLIYCLYWFWTIRKNHKGHLFLSFAVPVVMIGYVGGTIYHATRKHDLWLFLDWGPIALLCIALSIRYAIKLHYTRFQMTLLIGIPILINLGLGQVAGKAPWLKLVLNYPLLAGVVLWPIIHNVFIHKGSHAIWVIAAMVFFTIALGFRAIDFTEALPSMTMGTHWLWHIFGCLAVHLVTVYIYRDGLNLCHFPHESSAKEGVIS